MKKKVLALLLTAALLCGVAGSVPVAAASNPLDGINWNDLSIVQWFTSQERYGYDIIPNEKAADWLDSLLYHPNVFVQAVMAVLYYVLRPVCWPFVQLVQLIRVTRHAGVRGSGGYNYTFAYSTEKFRRVDPLPSRDTMRVSMGKNEREGLQIVLRGTQKNLSCTVELSEVKNGDGVVIPAIVYKMELITTMFGDYPDALVPYQGCAVRVPRRENHGFYIELRTNTDTPAGIYEAAFTVKDTKSGENVIQAPFTVEVFDVTFPVTPYSETVMSMGWEDSFFRLNGVQRGTPEASALYKQYYEYLLEHKISPYALPYGVLDPRADDYMSDPRVKGFVLYLPNDDATLLRLRDKVQSNPAWHEKGFFYPVDEPYKPEHFQAYIEATDRLARLWPGYNLVAPFTFWIAESEGVLYDQLAIQGGRSSILCPGMGLFHIDGFSQAIESVVSANDARLWWYTCNIGGPMLQTNGTNDRVFHWQQYQRQVTGFLYWCTTFWEEADPNPWDDAVTWKGRIGARCTGDGSLFYPQVHERLPGGRVDEPIPSLRLKHIADGLDDYDLLRMAEEKFGQAYSMEKAAQLSTSLKDSTKDPAKMNRVRASILQDLTK